MTTDDLSLQVITIIFFIYILRLLFQFIQFMRVRERCPGSDTLHHVFEVGNTIRIVKMLKKNAVSLSMKDPKGYTPLHYACKNGKVHCLEYVMNSQYISLPFSKLLQISSGYIFGNTPLTIKDDSGKVILHHACEKGSVQLVEKLLAAGAYPNVSDKYNCTPLHYACKRENLKIMHVLLKEGANPNAVDVLTGTPLHYACKTGNLHLVQTLIEARADHSIKRLNDGNTPLHDAVECGFFHCVDNLVNYSPNPGVRLPIIHSILFTRTTPLNVRNRCGKRVLHIACMKGNVNIVEKLLDAGADPNVFDDDAFTPLHNACQGGFVQVVDRLIRKGASCTAKNKLGYIPLHYACSKGYVQCVQRIIADNTSYQLRITTKCIRGDTPLTIKDPTSHKVIFHHACEQGNMEVVKMLTKEGADPTVQDFQGFTPLHFAFQNNRWDCASYLVDYCKHKLCQTEVVQFLSQFLLLACKQDDMEICRKLIGLSGDNLALTDNTGRTPINYACDNKNLPFMHSLLDYYTKITLNVKHKQILQPVVFFAFKEGNIDLLQKLLPMGIDLTVKDANGYSPLHYTCKLGHLHCLEHVMNSQNVSNLDELLKACGRDGSTPLTVRGKSDKVILHHACAKGSMKLVDTLISSGANVNVKDGKKFTPLLHACQRKDLKLVKKLIDAGSNPNAVCCDIGTPLHFAFKNGDANLVEFLLASGAQLSVANDTRPLHYAHDKKYLQCVDHVIKHCMEKMAKTEAMQALSPFLFAACTRGNVDLLERLIEVHVNFTVKDEEGYTALHYACKNCQLHCLEYVMSHLDHSHVHGLLQIPSGYIFGTTPLTMKDNLDKVILHHASEKGSLQLVKKLLEVGAKPDVNDSYNCTPLHYACKGGFVDVVSDLITAGANCRVEDKCGYAPIHYACQNGHLQCLDYLIDHCGASLLKMAVRDVSGTTPLTITGPTSRDSVLHHACKQGNLKIVEMFIKEGADPKIQNSEHFTPLHYACLNGHFKCAECIINHCTKTMPATECRRFFSSILSFSCKKGNIDVIKKLVGVGIDFTVDDLCSACQNSDLECVEYLIANHPYPSRLLKMTSKDGKTPMAERNSVGQTIFHVACAKGNTEVIKRLLAAGADPAVKVEQSEKTPLHIACKNGQWQCVDIICANCPEYEKLLQIFDKTLQSPIYTKDSSGKVILHHACEVGNFQLVKTILSAGSSTLVSDNRGCTPFCSACTNGHFQCAEYVFNHTRAKYKRYTLFCVYHDYKSQNADNPLRNKDRNGLTLMHFLCASGNAEALKQTVSKDSTLGFKMTDNYGNTPLHFACQYGHLRCVEILIDIYPKYMLQVDGNLSKTGPGSVSEHMASEKHRTTTSSPLSKSDKAGKNMLHHACEMGNVELVGKLISFGVSVHQVDNNGHTPLHYACEGNHVCIVEKYVKLASGPNLKVQDHNGYTPLHYACRNGNLRCIECLTDVSTDPYELFQVKSKDGFSPLTITGPISQDSVLHHACKQGNLKIVEMFIKEGADPKIQNSEHFTPLHYACLNGHFKCAECIINHCTKTMPTTECGRFFSSILSFSCKKGNIDVIKKLVGVGIDFTVDDLCSACQNSDLECVEYLIANHPYPSRLLKMTSKDGKTPMAERNSVGQTIFHVACAKGNTEVIKRLLAAGADPAVKVEQSEKTPLHIACKNGQWQCVDIICANCPEYEKLLQIFDKTPRSPIYTKDSSGKVILHHACEVGNFQLVKTILSAGSSTLVSDNRGCTPFCSACTNGHFQCAEYVFNHTQAQYAYLILKCVYHDYKSQNADNPLRNKDRNGLTLMHFLCASGNAEALKQTVSKDSTLGFKMTDNYGNTPLHFACQYGHLRCVEILIDIYPKYMLQVDGNLIKTGPGSVSEHMASQIHCTTSSSPLSKSDKAGKNMLHHACEMGNVELVGKLISFGVSVHQVDDNGCTPLHYACKGDHVRIVEKYVELASSPNLKVQDQNGYTPLHYACRNGNLWCVECLSDVSTDPYELFQVKSKDGFSPLALKDVQGRTILYRACQKEEKKLLNKLIGVINPYAEDADGYTLFMYVALYVKNKQDCNFIFQSCVKVYQGDINFRHKSSQKTALHLACESGNLAFIDQILECGALINLKDNKECTPLLVAFRNLKHLSSLSEFNLLDLVNLLIAKHCDVNVKDTLGNTALHYAAVCDHSSVPLALINAGSDITAINKAGKTFSDLASPKLLAEVKENLLEIERRQIVCVIGYQECGKSTLIASLDETLQLRSQGTIYRLYSRYFRQARLIEARTAGIDTKSLNSDSAGELIFFDFAGHTEYYVSHFAFLESALSAQGASVIFIMVVDLRCPEEERLDQCRTWLFQLNTILKNVKNKNKNSVAKVLLVGSHLDDWGPSIWKHADAVDSLKDTFDKLKQSLNSPYMSFVDCWGMDCRSLDSKGIRMLEKYLIQNRKGPSDDNSANKVPLGACTLFDRLKNVHVSITVEGIIKELRKGSTPAPFPLEPKYIDGLCQDLAASGLALYIPDRSTAGNVNGWLILQMDVILSHVHGKIFAPDNPQFPMHHKNLASVHGLVGAEDLELALKDCGPQKGFDVGMLKKILEVFEFYHIVDTKFLSEDIVKLPCSAGLNSQGPSQWLYFPSLVRIELPNIQELFPVHIPNCKWLGWELRTKYIFPPLFQQALFVRFGAKFVQHTDECETDDTPFLYNVGKNGMFWTSEFGVHIRVNIANKSIVRILACGTQVNHVVNQVADLAQEVHFVSDYHAIQARACVRKVQNGSLLACSFLVSNVIDVIKNGGTHAINLLDPYRKGVDLTEVFADWVYSLDTLEKMDGKKYSTFNSTVEIEHHQVHKRFNSQQFMDKYREQFLKVVAAHDIAGCLEIANILSGSEHYSIINTHPMDARERMYRYLRDNADPPTIQKLCDIMLNVKGYPYMEALAKRMKEDKDLNLPSN